MPRILLIFLSFIYFLQPILAAEEPVYILNDSITNCIYDETKTALALCKGVEVKKDIRGTLIRLELTDAEANYYQITDDMKEKLNCLEYFLAKIKNPVIIEVHTEKVPAETGLKNWEFASVVAGNVGDFLLKHNSGISAERIYSVGYGEFMPDINTSNNGGKYTNRVDIIILCSISGE